MLQGSQRVLAAAQAATLALPNQSTQLHGACVYALLLLALLGRLRQRRQHLWHETRLLPQALHRVPAQAAVNRWGHLLTGCWQHGQALLARLV
jgi:predicted component of type VI protein secretion system